MKLGFQRDEGWWTVGAHMLVCCLGLLAMWILVNALGLRSSAAFAGVGLIGWFLGDQIFHALRDRYLRRNAAGGQ